MAEENNKKVEIRMQQIKAEDVKNDELKKALQLLKEDKTRQNELHMFDELRKARLLVPAVFARDGKKMQIRVVLVNTTDGKTYFPAFTDKEAADKLQVQGSQHTYLVNTIVELSALFHGKNVKAEGVVINPREADIVLPRASIEGLAQMNQAKAQEENALKQGAIPAGVNVIFSEPRIYPTALVNAVYDKCHELKGINHVWFKQMIAGQAVSFALIVDADEWTQQLQKEIHDAAEPHAKNVPVIVLKYTDELEKKAVQGAVPLFDKDLDF